MDSATIAGLLGREHGGAAGERSAHLLGIQVTARAILRFLHARTFPDVIAPQHLAKNLTEHLDKVVSARWKQLAKVGSPVEAEPRLISPSPSSRRPRQAPGEAHYQQMLVLRESGLSTRVIAEHLGVTQRTIQHWLAKEHGPYAGARRPRRSPLDWSAQYLQARWEAGEHNGTTLWEELKMQGYTGSSRSVYRRLTALRRHPHKTAVPALAGVAPQLPFEGVTFLGFSSPQAMSL